MARGSSCLPTGVVQVRYLSAATLTADRARRDRVLTWLDDAERARHARYRHDSDRAMFLAGRAMARTLVGHALDVDPAVWRAREGSHGRPEVVDEPAIRFNLAHSADLVVCAVANGRDVGVDVEDRARPETDRHVVRRYCSADEADDIDARGEDGWRDRFLLYWTLKEAYLKACGLGISVPLAELSFTIDAHNASARLDFRGSLAGTDARWAFRLATPSPRHVLAIAVSVADGTTPAIDLAPFDPQF